jgi:hypothetical protein
MERQGHLTSPCAAANPAAADFAADLTITEEGMELLLLVVVMLLLVLLHMLSCYCDLTLLLLLLLLLQTLLLT